MLRTPTFWICSDAFVKVSVKSPHYYVGWWNPSNLDTNVTEDSVRFRAQQGDYICT